MVPRIEPARPPSRSLCSNRSTCKPCLQATAAAAIPANPPPIMATDLDDRSNVCRYFRLQLGLRQRVGISTFGLRSRKRLTCIAHRFIHLHICSSNFFIMAVGHTSPKRGQAPADGLYSRADLPGKNIVPAGGRFSLTVPNTWTSSGRKSAGRRDGENPKVCILRDKTAWPDRSPWPSGDERPR